MRRFYTLWAAVMAMTAVANAQIVAGFDATPKTTCTGYVSFTDTSSGNVLQWHWDFGDGTTSDRPNPVHRYGSNGSYNVTLIAYNLNTEDTVTKNNYITVNRPAGPMTTGDSVQCGQGSMVDLLATAINGGELVWYNMPNGGMALHQGDTFSTALGKTTTFYVQENQMGSVQKVGPADSTFGGGNNHTELDFGLVFNVQSPFILKSVKVYAQGAGPRTFQVKSAIGGNVIHSKTVDLVDGMNRVSLDFAMEPGAGYFIQIQGVPNLFRNNSGASYPYSLNNLVSIIRSNAGRNSNLSYYYYFYDWEVQGITCQSERSPVIGKVIGPPAPTTVNDTTCPGGGLVTLLAYGNGGGDLRWYDAPTGGNLIDTGGVHTENITNDVTYYVSEITHAPAVKVGPVDNTFGPGSNYSNQNNLGLVFDVLAPLTLKSVKVYAQGTGNRTIRVFDAVNGNLIHTKTVNVPNGESRVSLNFPLEPANGYYITCVAPQNLFRNNAGPSYPYAIQDLISINTSNTGQALDYYYFFYDWEVEPGICESERAPVSGIVRNTQPISLAIAVTNANCNGSRDGMLDLTVTGGQAPYTFMWSNGQTTEDATGLKAGLYAVTVTDVNGCSAKDSAQVGQPTKITAFYSASYASCGASDGLLDMTINGGTPAYTYQWSNGATTQDVGNLAAGNYALTVTDSRGCTAVFIMSVGNAGGPLLTANVENPTCNGDADGSIDLMVVGGTQPYTYNWSTGDTVQDISGLSSGNYQVTVTDNNGCLGVANYEVIDPATLMVDAIVKNAHCNGAADGVVETKLTGGTAPFTYIWSNGATTANLNGVTAGTYDVTVTDSNGCTDTADAIVGQPGPIITAMSSTEESCQPGMDGTANVLVSGGAQPFTFQWDDPNNQQSPTANNLAAGMYHVTVTDKQGCMKVDSVMVTQPNVTLATSASDANCNGGSDGSIDLTVAGGTQPYTYTWSDGQTTQDISGLMAGTYSVTVEDAMGCSKVASETVGEPVAVNVTSSTVDPSCGNSDGLIDITVTGGSPTYTYVWSNGATTQDAGNIPSGSYTVTVTDSKGCMAMHTAIVNDVNGPAPLTGSYALVSCHGGSDGAAIVTPGGGVSPYTYLWEDGQTGATATGLPAGFYSVTVTDNNGCKATTMVEVEEATQIMTTANIKDVSCHGGDNGEIDLSFNGGIPAHTFVWSNGDTTEDLDSLATGDYVVTVTDALGCSVVDTFTVAEPDMIVTTVSVSNASCSGTSDGVATVSAMGGTPGYTFLWSNGQTDSSATGLAPGVYNVTVTDTLGCTATDNATITAPNVNAATNVSPVSCNGGNDGYIDVTVAGGLSPYLYIWSNGATTEDVYNLTAGTYTLTVTDANGCEKIVSGTITEPTMINVTASLTQPTCGNADGLINITVSGGSPGYTYLWSNGYTSQDAGNVAAGSYTVTVTDAKGCVVIHTEDLNDAGGPGNLTFTVTNANCYGDTGSVSVVAAGGALPLTYMWSNGSTDSTFMDLAGNYHVTVTDNNGCVSYGTGKIGEPDALDLDLQKTNVACNGQNNGMVDLTVAGGTAPYTFMWNTGATTEDIGALVVGVYVVTVTDNHGCSAADSVFVSQPSPITLTTTVTNASCDGTNDGTITVNVTGGSPDYSYQWDDPNNQTTVTATGLTAGTYHVTVTDGTGCTAVTQATVTQPTVTAALSSIPASCNGEADGSIDLIAVGGTGPYTFAWSNGATTEDLTGLMAGTYSVTVTDANGCSGTNSETVTQPTAINVTANVSNSTCGNANGLIDLTVSGGTPGYTYLWSNGATGQDIGSLSAGLYSVTVTDAAGCDVTLVRSVNDNGAPAIASAATDVTCPGGNDGSIDITVSGGATPYTFIWSNGATTEDVTGLTSGSYGVTVTGNNGCSSSEYTTVGKPDAITTVTGVINESCGGCSDGSAAVMANGGVSPYSYLWDDSGSQTTSTATGLTSGTYHVTVTDANGCTATDSVVVSFTVGTPVVYEDHTVIVFPNPTRDVVKLGGDGVKYMVSVDVFDMSGRRLELPVSDNKEMDLSAQPSGIYLVKVNFKDQSFSTFRVYKH
ncbi:MAG: T9SS type A sorting domain-containing protein [Flavobacteriales bacterium]|nr:T9SS type A sorting domain-containing protein [Flavobacteriales bacterium]